ncbi:MAG: hypothetical protein DRQ08_06785 [Candidatus Latescibacterota bacterium]|nr:MAG: hypothetical protein DRQ08_06785 [Candidatus Latescibacterota bacterium]
MAIPGLILGLLGIPTSVFFLVQKPEDIIEQMMGSSQREVRASETVIRLGEGIRIGELLVIFDSVKIAKTYDTGRVAILTGVPIVEKAKPNYKFVIIKVKAKNIGKKKDSLWPWPSYPEQDYKLEVDKGYIYGPIMGESILSISLMPEETGSDKLVFEILKTTMPVKLHASIKGRRFTVNLK